MHQIRMVHLLLSLGVRKTKGLMSLMGKLLALKPYALVMLGEAYHETLTKQCDEQSAEGRTHLVETMNKLTGRTNGGHDG